MHIFMFIVLMVMAYLMGSLCSAIIVSKLFDLPDPRTEGSKNAGATNVLRLSGKKYAAMVMVGDVLKGVVPVLIARMVGASEGMVAFTVLFAVLGHMYPVFFEFKGGKGVATALGGYLAFHLIFGVVVAATWLIVAQYTRYSSLASLVAMALAPLFAIFTGGGLEAFPPFFIITLFIVYKHGDNISRLMDGTESKIKFGESKSEP